MSVEALIEKKNRETAGARRQVFGKRANDQQHHANLAKCVRIYVDEFRKDHASNNARAALREMQSALVLSERRLQS